MHGNHPPRLGHHSPELPPRPDRLPEHAHIGRQKSKYRRPVSADDRAQPAVRDTDKDQHIRNTIRQIIQNFTPVRLALFAASATIPSSMFSHSRT